MYALKVCSKWAWPEVWPHESSAPPEGSPICSLTSTAPLLLADLYNFDRSDGPIVWDRILHPDKFFRPRVRAT